VSDGIFRNKADTFKILSSYFIGGLGIIFCFYAAATEGTERNIQILICILGGAIGWCIGLYVTPTSEGEKQQLSEFGKAFLTLVSGFGLGKITEIKQAVSLWLPADDKISGLRILLFLSMIIIGALFTYVSRLFVKGKEEQLREDRAKTITNLKKSLAELESQN